MRAGVPLPAATTLAQARASVGRELAPPAREQTVVRGQPPARLAVVEAGRAVLRDLVDDEIGPAGRAARSVSRVAQVGDQRRHGDLRRRHGHRGDHRIRGHLRAGQRDRRLDVLAPQRAVAPLREEPPARHRQPGAGDHAELGRGLVDRAADPAPPRVDRDEPVERPARRDAIAGERDVAHQGLDRVQRGIDGGIHRRAPEDGADAGVRTDTGIATAGGAAGSGGGHRRNAARLTHSSRNRPP